MKNKKEKSQDQLEINLKINEDRKYHLDFEIIDLREQDRPARMLKTAKKSLKKVILHRINGKIGEC